MNRFAQLCALSAHSSRARHFLARYAMSFQIATACFDARCCLPCASLSYRVTSGGTGSNEVLSRQYRRCLHHAHARYSTGCRTPIYLSVIASEVLLLARQLLACQHSIPLPHLAAHEKGAKSLLSLHHLSAGCRGMPDLWPQKSS